MNKLLAAFSFLACFFCMQACTDTAVTDVNQEITGRNWGYADKVRVAVAIEDAEQDYDLYLNLRHTADYKYSNIFVLIHQSGPGMQRETVRKEFRLAYPDGEWLGSGSGNFYTCRFAFKEQYRFPKEGTYVFEIEQNMRDNPLRGVSNVGLRIEPSAKK